MGKTQSISHFDDKGNELIARYDKSAEIVSVYYNSKKVDELPCDSIDAFVDVFLKKLNSLNVIKS